MRPLLPSVNEVVLRSLQKRQFVRLFSVFLLWMWSLCGFCPWRISPRAMQFIVFIGWYYSVFFKLEHCFSALLINSTLRWSYGILSQCEKRTLKAILEYLWVSLKNVLRYSSPCYLSSNDVVMYYFWRGNAMYRVAFIATGVFAILEYSGLRD